MFWGIQQNSSMSNVFAVVSLLTVMAACAEGPVLERAPSSTPTGNSDEADSGSGDTTDDRFDDPLHPGNDDLLEACESGEEVFENYSLNTDTESEQFNVVFLLDDSGSMGPVIQHVVEELQGLMDQLLNSTESQDALRIALVSDDTKAAYNEFPEIEGTQNPFIHEGFVTGEGDDPDQDDQMVFYFNEQTGSKWSDIAFFEVFGQADYVQTLPDVIPPDVPVDHYGIDGETSIEECALEGIFYRPRVDPYSQEVGWPWDYNNAWHNYDPCIQSSQQRNISDYLLPEAPVNIIVVSDDDLNVNFDRSGFDPDDSNLDTYPEMTDLMYEDLVGELNANYLYHSIINKEVSGHPTTEIGIGHWALSQHTGGEVFSIQADDYGPIFDELTQAIIYSSQQRDLSCSAVADSVNVYFDDELISAGDDDLVTLLSGSTVQFSSDFFEHESLPVDSGEPFEVSVEYTIE